MIYIDEFECHWNVFVGLSFKFKLLISEHNTVCTFVFFLRDHAFVQTSLSPHLMHCTILCPVVSVDSSKLSVFYCFLTQRPCVTDILGYFLTKQNTCFSQGFWTHVSEETVLLSLQKSWAILIFFKWVPLLGCLDLGLLFINKNYIQRPNILYMIY